MKVLYVFLTHGIMMEGLCPPKACPNETVIYLIFDPSHPVAQKYKEDCAKDLANTISRLFKENPQLYSHKSEITSRMFAANQQLSRGNNPEQLYCNNIVKQVSQVLENFLSNQEDFSKNTIFAELSDIVKTELKHFQELHKTAIKEKDNDELDKKENKTEYSVLGKLYNSAYDLFSKWLSKDQSKKDNDEVEKLKLNNSILRNLLDTETKNTLMRLYEKGKLNEQMLAMCLSHKSPDNLTILNSQDLLTSLFLLILNPDSNIQDNNLSSSLNYEKKDQVKKIMKALGDDLKLEKNNFLRAKNRIQDGLQMLAAYDKLYSINTDDISKLTPYQRKTFFKIVSMTLDLTDSYKEKMQKIIDNNMNELQKQLDNFINKHFSQIYDIEVSDAEDIETDLLFKANNNKESVMSDNNAEKLTDQCQDNISHLQDSKTLKTQSVDEQDINKHRISSSKQAHREMDDDYDPQQNNNEVNQSSSDYSYRSRVKPNQKNNHAKAVTGTQIDDLKTSATKDDSDRDYTRTSSHSITELLAKIGENKSAKIGYKTHVIKIFYTNSNGEKCVYTTHQPHKGNDSTGAKKDLLRIIEELKKKNNGNK